MVYKYKIHVTSVDYFVTYEDINYDPYDTIFNDEETIRKNEAKANQMIIDIKKSLPQELDLEVEAEPEDLGDVIADAISEETGWLNNSFTYEITSQEEAD